MQVRWTKRALSDLARIVEYIALDKPAAAGKLAAEIREKTERLKDFPYMGRSSSGMDLREFVVHRHYLVTYRIRPDWIEVLQVWNTYQNRNGS